MSLFRHDFHDEDSSDEFATPAWFVQPIADAVGGFDLDPAAGAEDQKLASTRFTKDEDGLSQDWFGNVWLNPPFSNKVEWLEKAVTEVHDGNAELVVVLLPVDTSTHWFHDLVGQADLIHFQQGRLRFSGGGGSNRNPNFGIMLAVYGDYPDELRGVLNSEGLVFDQGNLYSPTEQLSLPEAA